jgi:hypothetical protein
MHRSATVAHDAELNPHTNNYPTSLPNKFCETGIALDVKANPCAAFQSSARFFLARRNATPRFNSAARSVSGVTTWTGLPDSRQVKLSRIYLAQRPASPLIASV